MLAHEADDGRRLSAVNTADPTSTTVWCARQTAGSWHSLADRSEVALRPPSGRDRAVEWARSPLP